MQEATQEHKDSMQAIDAGISEPKKIAVVEQKDSGELEQVSRCLIGFTFSPAMTCEELEKDAENFTQFYKKLKSLAPQDTDIASKL
jgi:hypothetical protein